MEHNGNPWNEPLTDLFLTNWNWERTVLKKIVLENWNYAYRSKKRILLSLYKKQIVNNLNRFESVTWCWATWEKLWEQTIRNNLKEWIHLKDQKKKSTCNKVRRQPKKMKENIYEWYNS